MCLPGGGGSKAASAAEKISWGSGGRCKPPRGGGGGGGSILDAWCPIRVYAGMGVVVVGGRGVLLFKFSIFHSIENTCKKYFCGNICRGAGGGGGGCGVAGLLEPPKSPSGSAPESPIQFVYAGVSDFFHCVCEFCFKCRNHNYFCCDFLLGLLIINLSFVANFEVECF